MNFPNNQDFFWEPNFLGIIRPIWQMIPDSLNLKDNPGFLVMTVHWKLLLCMNHAFFIQYPIVHSLIYFVLNGTIPSLSGTCFGHSHFLLRLLCFYSVGLMLYLSVKFPPTTMPFFDLILLACKAALFWASISVVCGLFLPGYVSSCCPQRLGP